MAVNSFDDVLNSLVSDDADREVLSGLVSKYPGMKDGWLRQSDYSRKLDSFRETERKATEYEAELNTLKPKFDEISKAASDWEKWTEENWDPEAGTTKAERFLREKVQELETKVGQDMTFDDINKFITEKGVVTKDVLASATEEVSRGFQGSAYFAATLNELSNQYYAEFGKPLKTRDFVAKLNEYGTNDLDTVYEKYTASDRQALSEKQRQKEIEQVRTEERKKAEEEFAAKHMNSGLPVDNEPGLNIGHLQAKLRGADQENALEKAELGHGTVAAIAAQDYRKGKFGTNG